LVQKGVYQVFYRLSLIFAGCKVVLPLGQSLLVWGNVVMYVCVLMRTGYHTPRENHPLSIP
jgi:hypothetical protein